MNLERIEICYSVQAWGFDGRKAWSYMGQRNTLKEARAREKELRAKYKRVRVLEHKRTVRVVPV